MAPKKLLPVAALCSALATGTPLAAWATPAVVDSLPIALSPAPAPPSTIACKRFSLVQATISTSGCLYRETDGSIVVDIERPDKENGPRAGRAICTWKSAAIDTDGDLCDVMLCIDIASTNDSANGAKVAFDSATHEEGGVCLGCVPSNADGAQSIISYTASLQLTKAGTDAITTGEAPLLFYTDGMDGQKGQSKTQKGSMSVTRGSKPGPIDIGAQTQDVQRILADPALLQMSWSGTGAVGIAFPMSGDTSGHPKDEAADTPAHVDIADDEPSSESNEAVPSDASGDTATEPSDAQPEDDLDLVAPSDVDAGNCCMMAALDHTETIDAASIEPVAAGNPIRQNTLITFPKTVDLVFLPSGEIVAPSMLTLLGAKRDRNKIDKLTVVDPATTATLRLHAVGADGNKTEEFDGEKLLVNRVLQRNEDISYELRLEGFDRARDADIIAAAIESPQRLMTLRFDYSSYIVTQASNSI